MSIHPKNTILFLAAVVLIVLGFSLFFLNKSKSLSEQKPQEVRELEYLSPNMDTETLENEVNQEDFSELDSELNDIELQLGDL